MLLITRKVDQSVRIGDRCSVTVFELRTKHAELRFDGPGLDFVQGLDCQRSIVIRPEGLAPVKIYLRGVVRGEAYLGFEAPLSVAIHREERYQQLQAEKDAKNG